MALVNFQLLSLSLRSQFTGKKEKDAGRRPCVLFSVLLCAVALLDSHLVEGAIDEHQGDQQEGHTEVGGDAAEAFADGDLHGEHTEEGPIPLRTRWASTP